MTVFTHYLTEKEEKKLMAAVRSAGGLLAQRDAAWMRLLRNTGIRVGTLHSLNIGHAAQALVNEHLQITPEMTKGQYGGGRILVTRQIKACLKALLRIHDDMGGDMGYREPLIISQKGGRMAVRSFEARLQHWRTVAGLKVPVSPHWFRHTLAKRMMKYSTSSDPRGVVQSVLQHRSIDSTLVYTRPDREEVDRALMEAQS